MKKVLLIGLDGATLEVIRPMAQKGFLPNLKKMMEEGHADVLNSTMPPLSPVAWTSMVTGVNPGKHGIFDFMERDPSSLDKYRLKFLCGGNRRSEAIWSYLDRKDKKSIVMNVPMTYPPDHINGVMVSGMDTPSGSQDYVFPPEMNEVLNRDGQYIVEIPIDKELKKNPGLLYSRYLKADDRMVGAALRLMELVSWDFFMIVFTSLDRSQHLFTRQWNWEHIDAERDKDAVLKIYREMDRYIGTLMEKAGPDVTTIIVSDHGFGYAPRSFSLNQWLISKRYMVVNEGFWQKIDSKSSKIAGIAHRITSKLLGELVRDEKKETSMGIMTNVDWSKTSAYSEGGAPKIIINRNIIKGDDDYATLMDQLVKELKELKDPDSGENVFRRVERKENIYKGPSAAKAADIITELNRGYVFKHFGLENYEFITKRKDFIEEVKGPSGEHLAEGILIASGREIKKPKTPGQCEIIDIAPTVLYLLGQEIPSGMDGRVLDFMLKDEFIAQNPLKLGEDKVSTSGQYAHTEEEEKEIAARLTNLGYM